jgi:hypothetical protein
MSLSRTTTPTVSDSRASRMSTSVDRGSGEPLNASADSEARLTSDTCFIYFSWPARKGGIGTRGDAITSTCSVAVFIYR